MTKKTSDEQEWDPVCKHSTAGVWVRVDPFGLLCLDCAKRARYLWDLGLDWQ